MDNFSHAFFINNNIINYLKIIIFSFLFSAYSHGANLYPEFRSSAAVLGQDLSRALELKGVQVRLGEEKSRVLVFFGNVRVVSKKMGGLRIGLIPELEVERMVWTVKSPGTAWCAELQEFFGREPVMAEAKFKGFELAFDSNTDFSLKAEVGEFGQGTSRLELQKVTLKRNGRQHEFPEARLFLEGSQAGALELAERRGAEVTRKLP